MPHTALLVRQVIVKMEPVVLVQLLIALLALMPHIAQHVGQVIV